MKFVMNCCRSVYLLTNRNEPPSVHGQLRNKAVSYMVQFSDSHSGCCSNDGLLWGLIILFRVKRVRRAHGRKRAICTAALIKNSRTEATEQRDTKMPDCTAGEYRKL